MIAELHALKVARQEADWSIEERDEAVEHQHEAMRRAERAEADAAALQRMDAERFRVLGRWRRIAEAAIRAWRRAKAERADVQVKALHNLVDSVIAERDEARKLLCEAQSQVEGLQARHHGWSIRPRRPRLVCALVFGPAVAKALFPEDEPCR